MRIFIFLIVSLVEIGEISPKYPESDRDESLIRHQRADEPLINPIWPETTPYGGFGYWGEADIYYTQYGGYYVEAEIGNPANPYKLLLSTDAEYSAVKTSKCVDCEGAIYHGDQSDTSIGWNETSGSQVITTVGGDYTGPVIKDRVIVGELTVIKVKLIATVTGSPEATKGVHDGVLSLRYESGDRGYFYRLINIDHLHRTVITFVFNQDRHQLVEEVAGKIWVGTRSRDYYATPMAYSYINSPYWVLGLQNLTMDDLEFCREGPCLAYVSLEEEFVLVHNKLFSAIANLTYGERDPKDGTLTVDCDQRVNLPPIRFEIGGERFRLTGTEYIVKEDDSCFAMFKADQRVRELEFILGTYFHENYVLELGVYQFGKAFAKGVGLGKRKYSIY